MVPKEETYVPPYCSTFSKMQRNQVTRQNTCITDKLKLNVYLSQSALLPLDAFSWSTVYQPSFPIKVVKFESPQTVTFVNFLNWFCLLCVFCWQRNFTEVNPSLIENMANTQHQCFQSELTTKILVRRSVTTYPKTV